MQALSQTYLPNKITFGFKTNAMQLCFIFRTYFYFIQVTLPLKSSDTKYLSFVTATSSFYSILLLLIFMLRGEYALFRNVY